MTAGGDPPSGTIRDWIERHAHQTPEKVSHLFSFPMDHPISHGAVCSREQKRSPGP